MEKVKLLLLGGNRTQFDFIQHYLGPDYHVGLWPNPQDLAGAIESTHPQIILKPLQESCVEVRERPPEGIKIPLVVQAIPCDPGRLREILSQALKAAGPSDALTHLVGNHPEFQKVKDQIRLFAACDLPVLIQGESGSGKELVARALHELSPRKTGPFLPVNCSAIPAALCESELFGVERGAFTGAVTRPGLWERAQGGTLFLDEIGEMPVDLQVKLLRALENHQAIRVGGAKPYTLDARIVAATHQDLGKALKEGRFREDFFYRINVLNLRLPPLRQRLEDLAPLVQNFLGSKPLCRWAMEKLQSHPWPGNVRELKNVLLRAQVLSGSGTIEVQHIFFDGTP